MKKINQFIGFLSIIFLSFFTYSFENQMQTWIWKSAFGLLTLKKVFFSHCLSIREILDLDILPIRTIIIFREILFKFLWKCFDLTMCSDDIPRSTNWFGSSLTNSFYHITNAHNRQICWNGYFVSINLPTNIRWNDSWHKISMWRFFFSFRISK